MNLVFFSPPRRPEDEDRRQGVVDRVLQRGTYDPDALRRIVEQAGVLMKCEIAALSIIDGDRQWFASSVGLDVAETSRSISFCGHAILNPNETFTVLNAMDDPRFVGNPLVRSGPKIRFYAGVPVHVRGAVVGTLCTIDGSARSDFSVGNLDGLQKLAIRAEKALFGPDSDLVQSSDW